MNDSIFELTIQRIMDENKSRRKCRCLSSFFKYYGAEQNVSRMELMTAITRGERRSRMGGRRRELEIKQLFCRSKGNTIEGTLKFNWEC